MKKVFLSIVAIATTALFYNVQAQDLTISGGNNVSAMICANGNVFTWGMNYWEVNSQRLAMVIWVMEVPRIMLRHQHRLIYLMWQNRLNKWMLVLVRIS